MTSFVCQLALLVASTLPAIAQHIQDHDTKTGTTWFPTEITLVKTTRIEGPVPQRQGMTSILHFWVPPAAASEHQPMTAPGTVPITMQRVRAIAIDRLAPPHPAGPQ
jgi:hypothetical protein